jgi:hypothetical protein
MVVVGRTNALQLILGQHTNNDDSTTTTIIIIPIGWDVVVMVEILDYDNCQMLYTYSSLYIYIYDIKYIEIPYIRHEMKR